MKQSRRSKQEQESSRQVEGELKETYIVHNKMFNVLTMVRKLHSIALMLNLPLLHTGQMVLH